MDRVQIKHQKYGIIVRLPDDMPFEELTDLVRRTFEKDRKFFEGAELSLSFRGRILSSYEEDALTDLIERCGGIRVLCLYSQSPETGELMLRVKRAYEHDLLQDVAKTPPPPRKEPPKPRRNVGEYMTIPGNLKSGEVYRTRENILVLGDVEEDAVIVSERNIVVLGSLYGSARAGEGKEEGNYFIASSNLSAGGLSICGRNAKELPAESLRRGIFNRNKTYPAFALLEDGEVTVRRITEEDLDSLWEASDLNLKRIQIRKRTPEDEEED